MPSYETMDRLPRRDLNVFYVLDTSGSMSGLPIQTLNRAMEETLNVLRNMAKHNGDANLRVAVLEFNSSPKWMQPSGPEDVEDFIWQDLTAGGMTSVGSALDELNNKMNKNAFLQSMMGAYLPIVIFMTDGFATDDYVSAIDRIKQNKWFNKATKIGFAIGDDPDVDMVAKVVGNSEAVIHTNELAVFAKILRFVSVTSSTMASVSSTSGSAVSGAAVVSQVLKENDNLDNISVPNTYYDPDLNPPPTTEPVTIVDPDSGWDMGDDDDEW